MTPTIFEFESRSVRTTLIDDDIWFVGKDVCRCLDLGNHHQAMSTLADDETKGVTISDPLGNNPQEMTCVSEPGLYRLIFKSRKEAAERFKRWVLHEVLPAIRRNGCYFAPEAKAAGFADLAAEANLADRIGVIRTAMRLFGRERAAALWNQLGLPPVPPSPIDHGHGEAMACLEILLSNVPEHSDIDIRRMLIDAADDIDHKSDWLAINGIYIDPAGWFAVGHCHPAIDAIFEATPWADRRWRLPLQRLRIPGQQCVRRFPECEPMRCTPLSMELIDKGAFEQAA